MQIKLIWILAAVLAAYLVIQFGCKNIKDIGVLAVLPDNVQQKTVVQNS